MDDESFTNILTHMGVLSLFLIMIIVHIGVGGAPTLLKVGAMCVLDPS